MRGYKKEWTNHERIFVAARNLAEALSHIGFIEGLMGDHHMVIEVKKVFAVAAFIVATGVLGIELSRGQTPADDADLRPNAAIDVAPEVPSVERVRVLVAGKGDLPIPLDCVQLPSDEHAECANLAYRGLTEPSVVVATGFGNTTTLLRVDAIAIADFVEDAFRSRH
jgi:hypothetical protein